MRRAFSRGAFIAVDPRQGRHVLGGAPPEHLPLCGNCHTRFLQFALLDLTDPAIGGPWGGLDELPLINCPTCNSFFWMAYRVQSPHEIEILEEGEGPDQGYGLGWREEFGDTLPDAIRFSLRPISASIQNIIDRLSEDYDDHVKTTDNERALFIAAATGSEPGGYPIVSAFNQIGGRAYLPQYFMSPYCPMCGNTEMQFLACLTNDEERLIRIVPVEVYLEYWGCEECRCIVASHRAT